MKEKQHGLQIRIVNPDLYAATIERVEIDESFCYYSGFTANLEIFTTNGRRSISGDFRMDEFEQDYGFIFEN